jgi:hypothetical protein
VLSALPVGVPSSRQSLGAPRRCLPMDAPRRALLVKPRGVATPSRAHRVNQPGWELGLPCRARRERVPAPRRRARVPSARRAAGLLFWPWRRSSVGHRENTVAEPAHPSAEPGP